MNKKRVLSSFIFVLMLLMVFATASFADVIEEQPVEEQPVEADATEEETVEEAVEAEVTVSLDETYTFIVDQYGTIISVDQEGLEPVTETVITFDEEGNMIVEEVEVDPYADMVGMTIVEGINSFVDPDVETVEYEFEVVTDPVSEELNAFLTAIITGDVSEEILAENPNALRFAMAEELGITPGKMHLLEKLAVASNEEELDYKYWSEMPVKEIMAEIKAHKKGTVVVTPDEEEVDGLLEDEDEIEAESQVESQDQEKSESKNNDKKNDKPSKPSKSKSGKGKKK